MKYILVILAGIIIIAAYAAVRKYFFDRDF